MSSKSIIIFITTICISYSCRQTNEQLLQQAFRFSEQKHYDKAIEIYTKVIHQNRKLQIAYYNRGLAFMAQKKYDNAIYDFDKVMSLQIHGNYNKLYNQDATFDTEETRAQVPFSDALYQKNKAKLLKDSIHDLPIDSTSNRLYN